MKKNRLFIIVLLSSLASITHAQNITASEILTFETFKNSLKQNHPIISQTDLLVNNAEQEILMRRGDFDPKLEYQTEQKTFDGKNYFNYQNTAIKIPTWIGADVKGGFERNGGQFNNNEVTVGDSYYLGVELPVIKNLITDKRRTYLEQAKVNLDISNQERTLLLNELYHKAYKSYWKWLYAYLEYRIYSNIYNLSSKRYSLVVQSWKLGSQPAIDTTEALSQLQQFEILKNDSYIKWVEEGLNVSNHIWDSTLFYKMIQTELAPDSADISKLMVLDSTQQYWLSYAAIHPKLKQIENKLESLVLDRKLHFQDLLPEVNLGAYRLERTAANTFQLNGIENNYKFGLDVSVPLRLSKGRGGYKLAKNKLQGTGFEFNISQRKIENEIRYSLNEFKIARSQVGLFDTYVNNLERLYRAEITKYQLGASTIFVINSRENKLLDAKIKNLKNSIRFQNSILQLYYSTAQLEEI